MLSVRLKELGNFISIVQIPVLCVVMVFLVGGKNTEVSWAFQFDFLFHLDYLVVQVANNFFGVIEIYYLVGFYLAFERATRIMKG